MVITIDELKRRIETEDFDSATKLKLAVDAYRLHLKHLFDPMSVVAIGKIDPLPHQIEAFVKMMGMLRPHSGREGRIRTLIADDVGLGKTILVGLVLKELILRKKIKNILIICPAGLQPQWKEELSEKFEEDFEIISGPITEGNPFKEKNRVILSVDYAKKPDKLELLRDVNWDLIIIDEAHKLKPNTQRFELGQLLSEHSRHILLVTATPHDGKIENFLALMSLVDRNLEPIEEPYDLRKYLEPIMIRRLKEEIIDFKGKKIFPHREKPYTVTVDYTQEERDFYDAVGYYVNKYYRKAEERRKTTAVLALYILHRRIASSLFAGLESLKKRKKRLLEPYVEFEAEKAEEDYLDAIDQMDDEGREGAEEVILGSTASVGGEVDEEINEIDELIELGERLLEENKDSKINELLGLLDNIRKELPEDKIIVFTEFKDTLFYLKKVLETKFFINEIHGGMSIKEREQQRDLFRMKGDILIGTDAAGEGLNLQFANIVINYELPWNPNRLEQRIGRVHRYNQKKRVYIYNYKTAFPIDNKVLDKILEKIEHIRTALGDRAVDVIGTLISEKEIMELFKISRTVGDVEAAGRADELIDQKLQLLKNIEEFLIKERFDLSKVLHLSRDENIDKRVVKFDIERFLLTFLSLKDYGQYEHTEENATSIYIEPKKISKKPACIFNVPKYENKIYEFIGTFDSEPKERASYIALGNQALSLALDTAMTFEPICLLHGDKNGVLLLYVIRFFDGMGNEIYSEPILLFKTENGIDILDPIRIWDFEPFDSIKSLDYDHISEFMNAFNISEMKNEISKKIEDVDNFVHARHLKDLELERKLITADFDWKIMVEHRKIEDARARGQNYLISALDEKIKELRVEYQQLIDNLEKSKNISWTLCGPLGCGIVVKKERTGEERVGGRGNEELKREVELAGMNFVKKKEEESDREIKYESSYHDEFRGYDILSESKTEKRLIEVKSFKNEISKIEISSNEWRVASENPENYYLYIVTYALSNPKLTIVKDPYNNLKRVAQIIPIQDFKVVISKLPEIQDVIE